MLVALVGAALGYGSVWILQHAFSEAVLKNIAYASNGLEDAIKLASMLVAVWAALLVHELGHLLTGLALGFRFYILVVGPLGIRRNPDTQRVQWYLNRDAGLYGGIAGIVPIQTDNSLRKKFAAIVAAGPLISLLMGVLTIWLGYIGANALTSDSSAVARIAVCFSLIFGVFSSMFFLATTIPGRTGPFFTDRGRFMRLIGGGHPAAVEQATLELLVHSQSGQTYATLNQEQIALLTNEPESSLQLFAHIMAYYRHLDRQEMTNAFDHLRKAEDLLDDQPTLMKIEVWKELAFAYAYIDRDVKLALMNWSKIKPSPDEFPSAYNYLFRAALARAQGESTGQINEWVTRGVAALPTNPIRSEDRLRQQLLASLSRQNALI